MTWNDSTENVVRQIGDISNRYSNEHMDIARYYARLNSTLMLLGIILGPLSGVIGTVSILARLDSHVLAIASALVAYISGIVVTMVKFGNYEKTATVNKIAAAKYTSLKNNTTRQLALQKNERVEASKYLEWLNISFDEIFKVSPLSQNGICDATTTSHDEKPELSNNNNNDIYVTDICDNPPNNNTPSQYVSHICDTVTTTNEGERRLSILRDIRTPTFKFGNSYSQNNLDHGIAVDYKYSDSMMKYEMDRLNL